MIARATLPRPEWDLSAGCPPEHLWRFFSYEYARHVPEIIAKYEAAKVSGIGFDECGNWNHVRDDDGENVVGFCIPAGFPDVPFLEALRTARFPECPRLRSRSIRLASDRLSSQEQALTLAVNWRQPDKIIKRDFERLLKESRPVPALEKRGRSEQRKFEADLKALGAYRLLESGLSAAGAIAYSGKRAGRNGPLYRAASEWYDARQRAIRVLERDFGLVV